MMEVSMSLLLEGIPALIVLVSLTFICLKIKSTKRNPEFLGVPGTLVQKNPDEEAPSSSGGGRQLPEPPEKSLAEGSPKEESLYGAYHSNNKAREAEKAKEQGRLSGKSSEEEEEEEENNNNEPGVRRHSNKEHFYSKVSSQASSSSSSKSPQASSSPSSSSPYAHIRDREHPYAQLEALPKHTPREHEYATLGEKAGGDNNRVRREEDAVDGKQLTYMTLSEANSEETYAAIEGTYAMIGGEETPAVSSSKRPSVDESGYTLVNKAKKKMPSPPMETLYAQVDKHSSHNGLEDMYAKVHKRPEVEGSPTPPPRPPSRHEPREGPLYEETSDGYEILRDKIMEVQLSRKDSANYEILPDFPRSGGVHLRRQDSSVGYETVPLEGGPSWNEEESKRRYESLRDPYATLSSEPVSRNLGVRPLPVGRSDPPYAELLKEEDEDEEEGYETIPRMGSGAARAAGVREDQSKPPERRSPSPKKDPEYDPAYEVVTKAHSEPAYETIESKSQMQAFEEDLRELVYEGPAPSSLIYMSVQKPPHNIDDSSPESNRRASVVVIERLDVHEGDCTETAHHSEDVGASDNLKEINTHIFV